MLIVINYFFLPLMIIIINYSVALIYKGLSENIFSCIGRMSTNMKNSISTYFIFVMYNEQKKFQAYCRGQNFS